MFVIKNVKRSYACYISENNTWEGLLKAKVFVSENEANEYINSNKLLDGKVYTWLEIVNKK